MTASVKIKRTVVGARQLRRRDVDEASDRLFSPDMLRIPTSPSVDRRTRRAIPTGTAKLRESSTARGIRREIETWDAFVATIRRAARSRLELMSGRDGTDRVSCPWALVVACDRSCRCGGSGMVTVDFLRDHYTHLASAVARFARRRS